LEQHLKDEHAEGFSEATLPILNTDSAEFNTRLCNKKTFIFTIYYSVKHFYHHLPAAPTVIYQLENPLACSPCKKTAPEGAAFSEEKSAQRDRQALGDFLAIEKLLIFGRAMQRGGRRLALLDGLGDSIKIAGTDFALMLDRGKAFFCSCEFGFLQFNEG